MNMQPISVNGTRERKWAKAFGVILEIYFSLLAVTGLLAGIVGLLMVYRGTDPSYATYGIWIACLGFALGFQFLIVTFIVAIYTGLWVKTHKNTCLLEEKVERNYALIQKLARSAPQAGSMPVNGAASSNKDDLSPAEIARLRLAILEGDEPGGK